MKLNVKRTLRKSTGSLDRLRERRVQRITKASVPQEIPDKGRHVEENIQVRD